MIQFDIRPLKGTSQAMRMISQWNIRAEGMMRRVAHGIAKGAEAEVLDRLPEAAVGLKKSLRVREITGLKEGHGYALMSLVQPKEVEEINGDTEILYVQAKRIQARIPQEIVILEDYGPWTIDTIPTWPNPRYARVITRTVRPQIVKRTREERKADQREWEAEFANTVVRRGRKLKVNAVRKAVPDVAFESLKYEFGIGAPPKPHWRPALINAKSPASLRALAKKVGPILTDPTNRKWSQRPTAGSVNVSKIGKLVPFQKTLGVHVR